MRRNVWHAHLKDNRDKDEYPDRTLEKAKYCFDNQIVAVGWAVVNSHTGDWAEYRQKVEEFYEKNGDRKSITGFRCAANSIEQMNENDLVWAVDPITHMRYLYCVKEDGDPKTDANQEEIDIGAYKKCEEIASFQRDCLPDCLSRYVARRALLKIHKAEVCDAIEQLYSQNCPAAAKQSNNKTNKTNKTN